MNNNTHQIDHDDKTKKPAKRVDFSDFDDLTNWITADVSRQVLRLAWLHNHDEIEVGLVALTDALCRLIRRCPHPDQRAALAADAIDKLRVFHIRGAFENVRIIENPSTLIN